MKRVPPSVRLKEEIEGLLGATAATTPAEEPPMVGFVGRLARYMLQVAIEAEATAFLGREHYRRGDRQRVGWRNVCLANILRESLVDVCASIPGAKAMSAHQPCG